MTLPQKNGHRIKMPSSKLTILVSSCWGKNFIHNNAQNFFILSLVFLKSLIVSVAFFLGHPVYSQYRSSKIARQHIMEAMTVFTREQSAKFEWSLELRIIPMTVFWPVCTQISITKGLFELRNSNDGPEMFSSGASLKSRSENAVWMPWPLKSYVTF